MNMNIMKNENEEEQENENSYEELKNGNNIYLL